MEDTNTQSDNDLLREIKKEIQAGKKFVSIVIIILSLMIVTLMLVIVIKNNKPIKYTINHYRIENKDSITDTIFEGSSVTTTISEDKIPF
jgi:hypothetical protein